MKKLCSTHSFNIEGMGNGTKESIGKQRRREILEIGSNFYKTGQLKTKVKEAEAKFTTGTKESRSKLGVEGWREMLEIRTNICNAG